VPIVGDVNLRVVSGMVSRESTGGVAQIQWLRVHLLDATRPRRKAYIYGGGSLEGVEVDVDVREPS
jgi:hypothetical protein